MTARSRLTDEMPFAVEKSIRDLGANLRTARLRRNLTMDDIALRVGVGRYVIGDAEKGKPTTSIAVYAAMLWVLDMLPQLAEVATPEEDEAGNTLSLNAIRKRARAPTSGGMLDDL